MIHRRPTHAARWKGVPLEALLLDLDGTLMDTAADVAVALNRALEDHALAGLPLAMVREMIGGGAAVLVERALKALGQGHAPARQAALVQRFLAHYDCLLRFDDCRASVFPGVTEGLRELHAQGLRLAVVTNKHSRNATALLQRLGLTGWIDAVIGGDSCERRKPDAQPLLFACATLHVDPAHALMVGDSVNDVQAARAAGLPVICVPYGYNEGQDPRTLDCDAFVDSLAELPGLLTRAPSDLTT